MNRGKGNDDGELRPEYRRRDFGILVRGKYTTGRKAASNVVVLRPEVAAVFPNADAVNDALLGLSKMARAARPTRQSRA